MASFRTGETHCPTGQALVFAALAVAAFHLAYSFGSCGFLMAGFLAGLFALARLRTTRQAFYFGLGVGLAAYGPQLAFFGTIFGPAALALWLVLAFWIGLFLALLRACRSRLGPVWAALLAPFLWMGLEFFRCELYPLRFAWLNAGYAFSESPQLAVVSGVGVYGIGFVLMAVIGLLSLLPLWRRLAAGTALAAVLAISTNLPPGAPARGVDVVSAVRVAGMQMEFPIETEVPSRLDGLLRQHPGAQLLVLSEYTFDGPIPRPVKQWCADHARHLIVGGKEPVEGEKFRNTAYVIGPSGETVFQQAKSVPIQFFKDGLPAPTQELWHSPWGRLGLAICYDLSYTRVMDRLVKLGAQGLIVPTMDVADWGAHEHRLHARIAPMRAAEYGLPLFRVASSGISQLIDRRGQVLGTAPFPGENATLAGEMRLHRPGLVPLDRWLAWLATFLTALLMLCFALSRFRNGPWRQSGFSGSAKPGSSFLRTEAPSLP